MFKKNYLRIFFSSFSEEKWISEENTTIWIEFRVKVTLNCIEKSDLFKCINEYGLNIGMYENNRTHRCQILWLIGPISMCAFVRKNSMKHYIINKKITKQFEINRITVYLPSTPFGIAVCTFMTVWQCLSIANIIEAECLSLRVVETKKKQIQHQEKYNRNDKLVQNKVSQTEWKEQQDAEETKVNVNKKIRTTLSSNLIVKWNRFALTITSIKKNCYQITNIHYLWQVNFEIERKNSVMSVVWKTQKNKTIILHLKADDNAQQALQLSVTLIALNFFSRPSVLFVVVLHFQINDKMQWQLKQSNKKKIKFQVSFFFLKRTVSIRNTGNIVKNHL